MGAPLKRLTLRYLPALFVAVTLLGACIGCQRSTAEVDARAVVKDAKISPSGGERSGRAAVPSSGKQSTSFNPRTVLSWPRMRADKFGCMLERVFNHHDPKFNCSLSGYKNDGDPCTNTAEYYSGPAFPSPKVASVDPLLANLSLEWEHGDLQAVSLTFKGEPSVSEIAKRYGLPALQKGTDGYTLAEGNDIDRFPNIESIAIQACQEGRNCLLIEGFDHMGAGDVDCEN